MGVLSPGQCDHLVTTQTGDHGACPVGGQCLGKPGERVVQGLFVRADRFSAHAGAVRVQRHLAQAVHQDIGGTERQSQAEQTTATDLLVPAGPGDQQRCGV